MRHGLEFTMIMLKSLPVRLQPIGSLCIEIQSRSTDQRYATIGIGRRDLGNLLAEIRVNRESDSRHYKSPAVAGVCPGAGIAKGAGRTIEGKALPAVARLLGEG